MKYMKKKLLLSLLSLAFFVSLGISAMAQPGSAAIGEDEFSDAYISFSEQLASEGISAQTCLENFISGYSAFSGGTLEQYITSMVEYEVSIATQFDDTVSRNLEIKNEYLSTHENTMDTVYSDSRSGGGRWYDNIGQMKPSLPQKANYDKYKILSTVEMGDIIYETGGGNAALVGHIAIAEGKYWDTNQKQYYIRTIEANGAGVTHGVLDDDRYDYRIIKVFDVTDAIVSDRSEAVIFCRSQLGKPWSLEVPLLTPVSYSSYTVNWYCSELVWAAYYNAGINLHGSSIPRHIYTPMKLASSSKLTVRDVT